MISTRLVVAEPAFGDKDLVGEAIAIGDRICREAVVHAGEANWFARKINYPGSTQPGDVPTLEQLGPSLYSGTAGVGLYLLRLHTFSGQARHLEIAKAAIRNGAKRAFTEYPKFRHGWFLGALGVAWCAHEAFLATGETEFRRAREQILGQIWKTRRQPRDWDVMFGAGGAIPALLKLHEEEGHELAWKLIEFHGRDLIANAHRTGAAMSWGDSNRVDLTGFSHGAGGIGWGLSFLYRATGKAVHREAADAAFEYERIHFDEEAEAWLDLRDTTHKAKAGQGLPRKFGRVWCHGAPGIGLSRIHASKLLDDPRLARDLRVAYDRTREINLDYFENPGRDMCVCHGVAGNAEAEWMMAEALGEPDALPVARRAAFWGLERFGSRHGIDWPSAVTSGQHPPLVTGIAGVGHWMLRLVDPDRFPTAIMPVHPAV